MITEDYVSFEIAKLLKENGFDEECSRWYVANEPQEGVVEKGFGENQFYINAPTIQMAMKWLREMHKIFITILFIEDANYFAYTIENLYTKKYLSTSKDTSYNNYEEACEAALKYSLEHLI
jgi:hypothetical protein